MVAGSKLWVRKGVGVFKGPPSARCLVSVVQADYVTPAADCRKLSGAQRIRIPESLFAAFRRNWLLYIDEALELALFMSSACVFDVLLYDPASPMAHWLPNAILRRFLMGLSMGGTAVLIIHSPMGKASGAHFNPAISLAYFRLGKITKWDTLFYVLFQFVGAVLGVGFTALFLNRALAAPSVRYVVTVPGPGGTGPAFAAELFMATLLMGMVLWLSNQPRWAAWTSYCVGVLITFYILLFAPISGFSINPARTTGSAIFAHLWTAGWIYFTAPVLGMLVSAEVYLRFAGRDRILCAKLHPDANSACPFVCQYPGHHGPGHTG